MYRIAFVGTGGRSGAHADAYQHIDGAELVACCARTREHADGFAAKYGIKPYSDIAEMVRAEKPDLVHVVTMPRDRVETMRAISDHRVPAATVEKPIAVDADDWRAICEIENTTRTKFGVCHQFRWQKDLVKCRRAIASGDLGKVLFIDSSAGMDITNQGTHALHYANSLNGDQPVVSVFGATHGWDRNDLTIPARKTARRISRSRTARGCSGTPARALPEWGTHPPHTSTSAWRLTANAAGCCGRSSGAGRSLVRMGPSMATTAT